MKIVQWLEGKKTYLGAIALGVLGIAWSEGFVSDRIAGAIASMLAAWTGVSLRLAIGKLEEDGRG